MTSSLKAHQRSASRPAARPAKRSNWWREVLIIAAFYGVYSLIRDLRGERPVSAAMAFTNAKRLIHAERMVGLFHEANVQHYFLHFRWIIEICDNYYDTLHFIAAIATLVVLFFWFPVRYRMWRNVLAISTGLALFGFYFFPLMPPRLLPPGYHFVDTLKTMGGLWNFQSGPASDLSDQYAAMPSLHTAWAVWCTAALVPLIKPWWGKALMVLYPVVTIFAIVVTANHYFGDVVAGLLDLAVSFVAAKWLTRQLDSRHRTILVS